LRAVSREDVEFGRGANKKASDDNGRGRGPGMEACLMQILPSMAMSYGGPNALLGDSEEALRLCFRAGIAQLRYAYTTCSYKYKSDFYPEPLWMAISKYVSGSTCISSNNGKTEARFKTTVWASAELRRLLR
jgi:hypothetical protein